MVINKSDLETLSVKLSFKGVVFKKLSRISILYNGLEYATWSIAENDNRKTKELVLTVTKGEPVRLIKKDKQGFEFDIWENGRKWTLVPLTAFLNYAAFRSYITEDAEIKYRQTGYGCMFYRDDHFIGRTRSETTLFSFRTDYFVDVIDMNSLDFLVAACTVEILKRYFYKPGSSGE